MTKLSAEAYAIVEGRHSDPFHYLGVHTEGDKTVVRAFLPEASKVEAIGEQHGLKKGKAQAPIRVAITGRTIGPPLFEALEVLGREEVIRRLNLVASA